MQNETTLIHHENCFLQVASFLQNPQSVDNTALYILKMECNPMLQGFIFVPFFSPEGKLLTNEYLMTSNDLLSTASNPQGYKLFIFPSLFF